MKTILEQTKTTLAKGTITVEEAKQMRNLYLENQYEVINTALKIENKSATVDSNHVTFDLEDLKIYIKKVEQFAEENNLTDLGLRIYLAAKKDKNNQPKTTIFFAPVHSNNEKATVFNAYNSDVKTSLLYNRGDSGNNGDDGIK